MKRACLSAAALAFCSLWVQAQTNRPVIWDMAHLSAVPAWTNLDRPRLEGVKPIWFSGPAFRGRPTRVFAWLGIPVLKAGEKAPAMVLIHGGGGSAFEEWVRRWVDRGYAAIAMDTCGQVPVGTYGHWVHDPESGPPGWGGFDQLDWPREDQWTFHAVADAILAHSLIRSLPEVDPERTGVTGISWGGYLCSLVAGIDHRFKLAVPVYGCGFYRDTVFEGELRKLGDSAAERWMSWWDPSSCLPEAALPMLWVNGSNDFAYTLRAFQKSYSLPNGPRTLCVRLRMPHSHGAGESPAEIGVFADSILKGGSPLPALSGQGREGRTVWVSFSSKARIVKAELNSTKDTGRWQDRKWDVVPATLLQDRFQAELPPGTVVYYFNLSDERNCVVSSEHVEIPPSR